MFIICTQFPLVSVPCYGTLPGTKHVAGNVKLVRTIILFIAAQRNEGVKEILWTNRVFVMFAGCTVDVVAVAAKLRYHVQSNFGCQWKLIFITELHETGF